MRSLTTQINLNLLKHVHSCVCIIILIHVMGTSNVQELEISLFYINLIQVYMLTEDLTGLS